MRRDELLKEIESLINEAQQVYGAFVRSYCLEKLKTQIDETKYKELKEQYAEFKGIDFAEAYQKWYSRTLTIIKVVLPQRQTEFEQLYAPSSNRKELTILNYTIQDAIKGIYNERTRVEPTTANDLIRTQIHILKSVYELADKRLNEINNMLELDVFEKELDSARHLLKNKYFRSAGAICGVLIEKHLLGMLKFAGLKQSKNNPTISTLNDDLYSNSIIDSVQYKFLLYLGGIRNKCDHNKAEDPTKEEIQELINGTEKVINTY